LGESNVLVGSKKQALSAIGIIRHEMAQQNAASNMNGQKARNDQGKW